MANPLLESLQISDPAARRPQAAPQNAGSNRSRVSGLDALVNSFADIEDPIIRSLSKQLVEANMSEAFGFRIRIPDPEDLELDALRAAKAQQDLRKDISKNNVLFAQAKVNALSSEDRTLLGIQDTGDLLQTNPDQFISVATQIGAPVTREDLTIAGAEVFGAEEAARRQREETTERRQEAISSTVSTAQALEKGQEVLPGQVEALFGQAREAAETASGENLGTGFGSDIDEDKGSEQFFLTMRDTLSNLQTIFPATEMLIPELLKTAGGKNIADQLEGLQTDEEGRLIVGRGDVGVTDDATTMLTATVMDLAEAQGVTLAQMFQQLGLPYAGVNLESFHAGVNKIATQKNMSFEDFATALGPRFLRATQREIEQQARATQGVQ